MNRAKIVVMPTDTIYGICTSASDKKSVAKIYEIKGRDSNKPFIILVSKKEDILLFGVNKALYKKYSSFLDTIWPGKVSVIFEIEKRFVSKFKCLHRGTGKLSFRVPKKDSLKRYLKTHGPQVAPSANPQGMTPAENITEARKYFGASVDKYISYGRRLKGSPSTIIEITTHGVNIVREGAKTVKLNSKQFYK